MTEKWKPITGYEETYHISNLGRVRRLAPSEHLLSPYNNGNDYIRVSLCVHGRVAKLYVHRLVAAAFLPPPLKDQVEVNHINGDSLDNRTCNLEWVTRLENERHAIASLGKSNRGEANGQALLTAMEVLKIRSLYQGENLSYREIAELFPVSCWAIRDIVARRRWKHI